MPPYSGSRGSGSGPRQGSGGGGSRSGGGFGGGGPRQGSGGPRPGGFAPRSGPGGPRPGTPRPGGFRSDARPGSDRPAGDRPTFGGDRPRQGFGGGERSGPRPGGPGAGFNGPRRDGPSAGGRPSFGGERSGQRPGFNAPRPEGRPGFDGPRPEGSRPGFGGPRPGGRPDFNGPRPEGAGGGDRPGFGGRPGGRPAFNGPRPEGRPGFGGPRPGFNSGPRPDGPRPEFQNRLRENARPDGPRREGPREDVRPSGTNYRSGRPAPRKTFVKPSAVGPGRMERQQRKPVLDDNVPLQLDLETQCLIFGKNSVVTVMEQHPGRVSKILLAENLKADKRIDQLYTLAKENRVIIQVVPKAKLDRTLDGATPPGADDIERLNHQGVIALVSPKEYSSLEDTIARLAAKFPKNEDGNTEGAKDYPLVLVLDGVTDPRNLGAILRVADGAGVDAVILPKRNSAGLAGISAGLVAKVASGAEDSVEIALVGNLSQAMEQLKEAGFWLYGATGNDEQSEANKGMKPQFYHKPLFGMPIALLLGAEGDGLGRLVTERCDALVKLPMRGVVNSLNVATAAAVLTYEIKRQQSAETLAV